MDTLRTRLLGFLKPSIGWFDVYMILPTFLSVPAEVVVAEGRMAQKYAARFERCALTGLPGPYGNRFLTRVRGLFLLEVNTLPCSRYERHSLTQ